MINYDVFKEEVLKKLMNYMGEAYKGYALDIRPVNKVNRVLDGLQLINPDAEGKQTSAVLYINDMYEKYLQTDDLDAVLRIAAETLEKGYGEIPEIYVLENTSGLYGADMFCEDILHTLAKKLGTDLYIMPLSIHGAIAVPATVTPCELAQVVGPVTMFPGKKLSHQVYHYDRDLRRVSLATDTPGKQLDTEYLYGKRHHS